MVPYSGPALGYQGSPRRGVYLRCPDGTVVEVMYGRLPLGCQVLELEPGEQPPILLRVWFKSLGAASKAAGA